MRFTINTADEIRRAMKLEAARTGLTQNQMWENVAIEYLNNNCFHWTRCQKHYNDDLTAVVIGEVDGCKAPYEHCDCGRCFKIPQEAA